MSENTYHWISWRDKLFGFIPIWRWAVRSERHYSNPEQVRYHVVRSGTRLTESAAGRIAAAHLDGIHRYFDEKRALGDSPINRATKHYRGG